MNRKIFKNICLILIIMIILIPTFKIAVEETTANEIMLGDVNDDKKVDINDILLILRHRFATINKNHDNWILKGSKFTAADVTKNNAIDASDILAILRYRRAKIDPNIAKQHPEWIEKIEPKHIETSKIEAQLITLNTKSLTIYKGQTGKLTATIMPTNAENKIVKWKSYNENIAKVDQLGNVLGINLGNTIIQAETVNGKKATCSVTVRMLEIPVTDIELDKTSLVLNAGDNAPIMATVKPDNASDKTLIFTSSNPSVVTVSEKGILSAKSAGSSTITIKTSNGITKTCKVNVIVSATKIELNKSSININRDDKNKTIELTATITPKSTTDQINWTSSNTNVATINKSSTTVDANGNATIKVTLKSDAPANTSAIITAQVANNSNLKATCKIVPITSITSITLKAKEYAYTGKEVKPSATVKAKINGKEKTLTEGTDYNITYKNNKKVGTATATIKGKGYYTGAYSVKFKILKDGWYYEKGYKLYYKKGVMQEDLRGLVKGPYRIKVSIYEHYMVVYAKDGKNGYIIPVKKFVCSAGNEATGKSCTPVGTYSLYKKDDWHYFTSFGTYVRYAVKYTQYKYFHSIVHTQKGNVYSMFPDSYYRLGKENDSAGCIHMLMGDLKWLYDNMENIAKNGVDMQERVGFDLYKTPKVPPIGYKAGKGYYDPTTPGLK